MQTEVAGVPVPGTIVNREVADQMQGMQVIVNELNCGGKVPADGRFL